MRLKAALRRARRGPVLIGLLVAYVVAAGTPDPEALIDYVAQQLSAHKRPREVRFLDALPRNAMGKVMKKELSGPSA